MLDFWIAFQIPYSKYNKNYYIICNSNFWKSASLFWTNEFLYFETTNKKTINQLDRGDFYKYHSIYLCNCKRLNLDGKG